VVVDGDREVIGIERGQAFPLRGSAAEAHAFLCQLAGKDAGKYPLPARWLSDEEPKSSVLTLQLHRDVLPATAEPGTVCAILCYSSRDYQRRWGENGAQTAYSMLAAAFNLYPLETLLGTAHRPAEVLADEFEEGVQLRWRQGGIRVDLDFERLRSGPKAKRLRFYDMRVVFEDHTPAGGLQPTEALALLRHLNFQLVYDVTLIVVDPSIGGQCLPGRDFIGAVEWAEQFYGWQVLQLPRRMRQAAGLAEADWPPADYVAAVA